MYTYTCIYFCVTHAKLHHSRDFGQLMGVARYRMCRAAGRIKLLDYMY